MKKKRAGDTDLEMAPLVLGGNVFGWTIDEKTSFRLLDIFTDNGFNCIDTADSYSSWAPGNKGGESETIIGNWFKKSGRRNDIILITKVGWEITNEKRGLSKKYIFEEIEASLKRLQTDHIDLYFSHKEDPGTPQQETLEAYDRLIKQGKVRYIGASNFFKTRIEEAMAISKEKKLYGYRVLQPKYNLYDRQFEIGNAEVVRKYNLGVITYSSLASGFLSGKYNDASDFNKSVRGHGMKKYLDEKGMRILKSLRELSEKYKCSPAAISLAWLIHNPLVTAPIASATTEAQLSQLMLSSEINLNEEDIAMLNKTGE